jgi:hypothetical protein
MADFDYSGYDFTNDPSAVPKAAYSRLLSLGVAPQTAAGALGSLMGESGDRLNTKAVNKGDGADGSDSVGFGQWNSTRAQALKTRAQQMGVQYDDPRAQIEHMAGELQGTHKHVLDALRGAGDDLGKGTDIWTRKYEVPGDPDATMYKRASAGLNFYNQTGRFIDPATTGSVTPKAGEAPVAPSGPTAPIINRNPMAQQPVGALAQGAPGANGVLAQGAPEEKGSFWSPGGNFLGIKDVSDIGKRLQVAAGWMAPQAASGAASIMGAQTNAANSEANIANTKFQQGRQLKKDAQEDADRNNPDTDVSLAPSKKALNVVRKNKDGTVSYESIPLTSDAVADTDASGKTTKEKPAPASILKLEKEQKQSFSSSVDLVENIDDVVKAISSGKVSLDAISQGMGYLKNHTDSSDYNAQVLKKAKSAIAQLAQQRVKLEGGNPSDFRIRQAEASILPSGGEYDTAQVMEALVRARKVLAGNLRDSASGLGSIYAQHPSLGQIPMPGSGNKNGEHYVRRYGEITADDDNYYKAAEDFVKNRNSANKEKTGSNPARSGISKAFPGLF